MLAKIAIPLSFLASAILRVALPYHTILGGSILKFANPDSYYHAIMASNATKSTTVPFYDTILYHSTYLTSFMDFNASLLVLPLILHFASLLLIFFIGKKLWDVKTGCIAMLLLAVIPGEYMGRTVMGNIDYHGAEVFLTTCMIYFIVLPFGRGTKTYLFSFIGLFVTYYIYSKIWNSGLMMCGINISNGLLFVGIIFAYYWLSLFIYRNKISSRIALIVLAVVMLVMVGRVFPVMLAEFKTITWSTTLEALPLFYLPLPLATIASCLVVIVALPILWREFKSTGQQSWLMLLVWSGAMLLMTVLQRRFGYYLAINAALLTAFLIIRYAHILKIRYAEYILTGLVCISMIPFATIESKLPYAMPDNWEKALLWVRENTPEDAEVAAWWDYGYWIEYVTGRGTIANGSQDNDSIKKVAQILTTEDDNDLADVDILILDKATLSNKYGAVIKWAGVSPTNPVINQLWFGESDYMRLVYDTDLIKIYQR